MRFACSRTSKTQEATMASDFIRLTAKQIRELPKTQTVFFFPVGPLEDHGPHLPVGLDLTEADHLCRLAAERLEREKPGWVGIIMPSAPLGVSSNTSELAITVRGYVLRDWLIDCCRSLIKPGFRHFVCFSGQLGPRQLTAIEEAGKGISWLGPFQLLRKMLAPSGSPEATRPTFCSASSALVKLNDAKQTPFWSDPVEHGSQRDTSIALSLGWMNRLPFTATTVNALGLGAFPRAGTHLSRGLQLLMRKRNGYWGKTSPAAGQAKEGEFVMQGTIDDVFPKLRAAWEGTNPGSLFRSWYSILPPNKSFFKAWMIALLVVATLFAWLILSLGAIIPH